MSWWLPPTLFAAEPADSVVAIVGDNVVLSSEYEQTLNFIRISQPDTIIADSTLGRQVLDGMISDLVLEAQAKVESVDVTSPEVAAEVDMSVATLKERFGSDEKFASALAFEGLTEKTLRQRYEGEARRKLLARKLMEKEGLTQVYISPAEAERFYDANVDSIARVSGRVRLAHILVPFTPGPSNDSLGQRRMTEIIDVLARGGDFATVARSFSDDKKTAARGGDRGWVTAEDLRTTPEMLMVLSQLKPGQVSPPFPTRDGYMTVKLEEKTTEKARFRQILVRVPVTRADTARARSTAEGVRKKAAAGAPFDSLARVFSQDPATADSGGVLGEFPTAALTAPFDKVVATMDSGAVSEPVKSEHGYHILKVLAMQPDKILSYLEMQDNIRNYLYQQRLNERLKSYVDRVSGKVFVKRFGPQG